MKIYRVWTDSGEYFDGQGSGFQFFPNKKEAWRYLRKVHEDNGIKIKDQEYGWNVEVLNIEPTKQDIIKHLNQLADF
jgi:hypothetical protein